MFKREITEDQTCSKERLTWTRSHMVLYGSAMRKRTEPSNFTIIFGYPMWMYNGMSQRLTHVHTRVHCGHV